MHSSFEGYLCQFKEHENLSADSILSATNFLTVVLRFASLYGNVAGEHPRRFPYMYLSHNICCET